MAVIDADGNCSGYDDKNPLWVKVKCRKCGIEEEYLCRNKTEALSIACPNCNGE
jgi:hypothetical protein